MATIKLLSWHQDVAAKAASLEGKGLLIDAAPLARTSAVVGDMARLNPAVLVLDLDQRPSHSREIALMLRASKSARHLPILFAGSIPSQDGLPAKYARLRSELPDIPYITWPEARSAVLKMIAQPATAPPVVPPPRVYTASLAQKLGLLASSATHAESPRHVALVGAPEAFVELLGDLPETISIVSEVTSRTQLAVCFVRTLVDLAGTLDLLALRLAKSASVWIVYPKLSNNRRLDFNGNDVRSRGLATGFVDYKVCSIDETWSALKFAWRKPK